MTTDYQDQVLIGTRIEEEHRKTYDWLVQCFRDGVHPSSNAFYAHIAMDHVRKDTMYYDKLEKAGL